MTFMIIDTAYSKKLAKALLDIHAVVLRPQEPFVWSSGWNAPIYCDNRLTLLYPELRSEIADTFVRFLRTHYADIDVVTGTATAGIPHAAWVADRMQLPMAYVRSKAKSYGMGNQIEGGVKKGQHTVVIEDLVSTGGSVISVVDTLRFVGAEVDAVLALFTYGFDVAHQKFVDHELPLYYLTDYATLVDVARETQVITADEVALLEQWRNAPDHWPNER
jgi:orotate phosphoribosyltransferase